MQQLGKGVHDVRNKNFHKPPVDTSETPAVNLRL